jgi:hypothetical protein
MINDGGFITLNRKVINHWCSSDPNFLAVWVRLLTEANWENKKSLINSHVVEIKRGQLIFGLNAFSHKSGVSVMKLRRIIKILEDEGMINRQKTNKYSMITITKYDEYQSVNKQRTSKEQADNKQITTPKPLEPLKPFKQKIVGSRITADWKPSQSLVDQIILKEKSNIKWVEDHVYTFVNYWLGKTGRDATKTDWNATFRNWCANSFNRPESSKHQETCADYGVEETDEIVITKF